MGEALGDVSSCCFASSSRRANAVGKPLQASQESCGDDSPERSRREKKKGWLDVDFKNILREDHEEEEEEEEEDDYDILAPKRRFLVCI